VNIFSKIHHLIFKRFINHIESDERIDALVWRYPTKKSKIRYEAKLDVKESQLAILFSDGHFADMFPSGTYMLTTATMPILATLKNWNLKYKAAFKSEIYFINMHKVHEYTGNGRDVLNTTLKEEFATYDIVLTDFTVNDMLKFSVVNHIQNTAYKK